MANSFVFFRRKKKITQILSNKRVNDVILNELSLCVVRANGAAGSQINSGMGDTDSATVKEMCCSSSCDSTGLSLFECGLLIQTSALSRHFLKLE